MLLFFCLASREQVIPNECSVSRPAGEGMPRQLVGCLLMALRWHLRCQGWVTHSTLQVVPKYPRTAITRKFTGSMGLDVPCRRAWHRWAKLWVQKPSPDTRLWHMSAALHGFSVTANVHCLGLIINRGFI